jgi:biotin carboxyl carrier protein
VSGAGGPELEVTPQMSRSGLVNLLVAQEMIEVQPLEGEARYREERFSVHAKSVSEGGGTRPVVNGEAQGKIVASMPGRIVRVLCEPGLAVEQGSPLVVIEAMKMQNELCAKTRVLVRAVHVSVGQVVERGALLIEFE